ncbi:MAG TPA: hypothetical protein VHH35_04515 [Pyrinomonadaceae bacterium]|nr:hypothetical protein [Pyrinomonadaceae bacterium]
MIPKFALFVFLLMAFTIAPQRGSLCNADEKVIFNCTLRNSKIVSLCSSPNLTKDQGYVQYRFGRPGKIELEFPQEREKSQQAFKYTHYFRAQVDLTEITFTSGGHQYSIFDDYNGEERRARTSQGVKITPPNNGREVTLNCRERAKADYSNLGDVFATEP